MWRSGFQGVRTRFRLQPPFDSVLLTQGPDKTEEVRKLAMGRLLAEISGKMDRRVAEDDENPHKLLIHSTHDTAIAGLLGTLEVFDDR